MSKSGKVSLIELSTDDRVEKRERVLYGIIGLTFITIWNCHPFFPNPENYFLFYLIPTLLTFVARKRATILGVGAASILAAALDISRTHSFEFFQLIYSREKLQPEPALVVIFFALTLQLIVCYFSVRQWRILTAEQSKRAQRDALLLEVTDKLTALGRRQAQLQRLTSLLAENAPVAIAQLTPDLQYAMEIRSTCT